jgi:hypothetical protein
MLRVDNEARAGCLHTADRVQDREQETDDNGTVWGLLNSRDAKRATVRQNCFPRAADRLFC